MIERGDGGGMGDEAVVDGDKDGGYGDVGMEGGRGRVERGDEAVDEDSVPGSKIVSVKRLQRSMCEGEMWC